MISQPLSDVVVLSDLCTALLLLSLPPSFDSTAAIARLHAAALDERHQNITIQ